MVTNNEKIKARTDIINTSVTEEYVQLFGKRNGAGKKPDG
jgi:hypothetical protein